jgi:hypothetical protein
LTVSVASSLVVFPAELLTTTRNVLPLSDKPVGDVVYLVDVAPTMALAPFCH